MGESTPTGLSETLINAALSKSPSQGFTHTFYKYPARFSPEFARAAIHAFTQPGDVILDPFMGSGTTLVEALVAGRHAIGADISSLACFLTQVKTTLLTSDECDAIWQWANTIQPRLKLRQTAIPISDKIHEGYQREVPWWIKKTIALVLRELDQLPKLEQRKLVRCALLRAGQWALDCTKKIPSASEFRVKFLETLQECFRGLLEMREAIENSLKVIPQVVCLNVPAAELDTTPWENLIQRKPNLIVTSPPYPSVHVVYHRWQIKSRKETPAPFWIADELDGHYEAYYTMGSRTPTGLNNYFRSIEDSFSRLHAMLAEDAVVVQLLAFSAIEEQLPRFLAAMERASFQECDIISECDGVSERVWRQVPSRRWYATYKGNTSSSREVLLVHRRLS
jgi:DNA modification methylase